MEGLEVGMLVGFVGVPVGDDVGELVGFGVGELVGRPVGENVGTLGMVAADQS